MRILTALVIGLGVLIVAAAGLLAYGVFTRMKAPETAASPAGAGFGALDLDLPEGCGINSVAVSGETLVVHTRNLAAPNALPACDRIYVLHATSGKILGIVNPGPRRP
jgi:hypothetical protein